MNEVMNMEAVVDATTRSSPPPNCRWAVGQGAAAIDRYANIWNALAHRSSFSPTADAIWTRCFWKAFGSADEQFVLHILYEDHVPTAVVPLRRTGGILRVSSAIANGRHTPYWMFALDESRAAAMPAILDHLLESCDVLDLGPLHSLGPLCAGLADAALSRQLVMVKSDAGGDTVTDLAGPWEAVRRSLPGKLETGTRRQYRQLQQMGDTTFETMTGGSQLDQILQECFALEALGWKGAVGSPIKSTPDTLLFYTALAHEAAACGRLALYTLRLGSKLIAFDFCLRAQGKIDLLKISYDPALARYSPGNVLRYLVFQKESEDRTIATYHFGQPSEWKLRWASRVEPLCRLRIYRRNLKGHVAFYIGPRLRAALKNRWTVAAVSSARAMRRRLRGR